MISVPSETILYSFQATAGKTIVTSVGKLGGAAGFDPGYRLFGPNGTQVGTAGSVVAPLTGTYSILVFDSNSNVIGPDTGSYKFHLFVIPEVLTFFEDGGVMTNGANHDGAISHARDLDAWTFHATAGQAIVTSVGELGGTAGFDPSYWLYGPNGIQVGTAGSVTAPSTGTYTIIVFDSNSNLIGFDTGSYRLHLFVVQRGFTIADDGGTMTNGSNHNGAIGHARDLDAWTFHATAGQAITHSISKLGGEARFNPNYWLYRPDGVKGSTGSFVAPLTGIYTIIVFNSNSNLIGVETGSYSLYLNIPQPPNSPPPVVFIPGIAGSRLAGGEHQGDGTYLWPTIRPDKMEALHLTRGAQDVRATGVIEEFNLQEDIGLPIIDPIQVYRPFLDHLRSNGRVEFDLNEDPSRLGSGYMLSETWSQKPSLFTFPYDWRKEIGSHTGTLHTYISHIRQLHGNAKVRVVAHSMGCLLLRRYMIDYGVEDLASVVTVAPPVWGSPQAVFRLHTGLFFGPGEISAPIDWITRDEMKAALWSFPAVAELLPSTYYMLYGGALLFSEEGWDYNRNGDSTEIYNPIDYFSLMTDEAVRQGSNFNPILVNQAFYTPAQCDWSDMPASIPVLLITGHSRKLGVFDTTPISMIAHGGAWWTSLNPGGIGVSIFDHQRIDPVFGPGDSTVPLLSSQRLPAYLPPNTILRPITGGAEASHTGLFGENPQVTAMIFQFLQTGSVPEEAPAPPSPDGPKNPEGTPSLVSILIKGRDFVKVKDGEGNENIRYTPMAAAKVSGAEISYDRNSVLITHEAGGDFTVENWEGNNTAGSIEIEIAEIDQLGTVTRLRRYRTEPESERWGILRNAENETAMFTDANSDGVFQPGEERTPDSIQSGETIDTTPPVITLQIAALEDVLSVTLSGSDNSGAAPLLRYSTDAISVNEYTIPVPFVRSKSTLLTAFAEDASGNTSGLIRTTIQPPVTAALAQPGVIKISWPQAEAYVLEQAANPAGPWEKVAVPVSLSEDQESVEIPVSESRLFFRLGSRAIQR